MLPDESPKAYRDNKNTMDYAIEAAREEATLSFNQPVTTYSFQ